MLQHLLDYCSHNIIIQATILRTKHLFLSLLRVAVWVLCTSTTAEELNHRFLSMELSPAFLYFLPVWFNYSAQHVASISPLHVREKLSHSKTVKISFLYFNLQKSEYNCCWHNCLLLLLWDEINLRLLSCTQKLQRRQRCNRLSAAL